MAEQLPFPFAEMFLGFGEFNIALDELGKRNVAPAPELGRGRAGDARDGGVAAFVLDGDFLQLLPR